MEWEQLIIQVLYILIATFIPIIGLSVRGWLESKRKYQELMEKQELIQTAVKFAEKVYYMLEGPEKFQHALEWASAMFSARGFKISAEELKGLIEKAVYDLDAGWDLYEDEA